MIFLRSYQKTAFVKTVNFLKNKTGNPIIALPTGTGKSLVIAALIRYYTEVHNERVLILTHVKELINQNYETALTYGVAKSEVGIYSAGLGLRENNQIVFAGIASIHKKDLGQFDKIIIDECHLVPVNNDTMYRRFLATQSNARVIGLSATPYRLNGGHLKDGGVFTAVSYDKTKFDSFDWFIDRGYLAPLIAFESTAQLNIDNVHIRGGEFVQKELQQTVNRDEITRAALNDAIIRAKDRKHWLVFTTGVEHSESVTKILNELGVDVACVHHKKTKNDRDEIIDAFRSGRLRAIVNSQILTTGFDAPHIDAIVMLRPMMSPGLWVQSLGRGTRPYTTKTNCLVLDYAGNTRRLGPINNVVIPDTRTKSGKRGRAPVRVCPKCRAINPLNAKDCFNCDYVFPRPSKITTTPGQLDIISKRADEILDVTSVKYFLHVKKTRSLRVMYVCGRQIVQEWIYIESFNRYLHYRALNWWRKRTPYRLPKTVDTALEIAAFLKKPRKIVVSRNGKYPEIKRYVF